VVTLTNTVAPTIPGYESSMGPTPRVALPPASPPMTPNPPGVPSGPEINMKLVCNPDSLRGRRRKKTIFGHVALRARPTRLSTTDYSPSPFSLPPVFLSPGPSWLLIASLFCAPSNLAVSPSAQSRDRDSSPFLACRVPLRPRVPLRTLFSGTLSSISGQNRDGCWNREANFANSLSGVGVPPPRVI